MTIAFKPTATETTIEHNGSAIATLDSTGLTMASGKTISGSGVGKVLQVVQSTKTDIFSTSSTSYTDITGLSVSITPSSTSSKILIMTTVTMGKQSGGGDGVVQLLRDSTAIGNSTGVTNPSFGMLSASYPNQTYTIGINYLDSPSTTSSITYKIQTRTDLGSVYVNRRGIDTGWGGSSTITVMEVAG